MSVCLCVHSHELLTKTAVCASPVESLKCKRCESDWITGYEAQTDSDVSWAAVKLMRRSCSSSCLFHSVKWRRAEKWNFFCFLFLTGITRLERLLRKSEIQPLCCETAQFSRLMKSSRVLLWVFFPFFWKVSKDFLHRTEAGRPLHKHQNIRGSTQCF